MAVVAGTADTREGARPLDREFALRQRDHRLDDGVDASAPGPLLGRRAPLRLGRCLILMGVWRDPRCGRSHQPKKRVRFEHNGWKLRM
jgi:hypothetical protein